METILGHQKRWQIADIHEEAGRLAEDVKLSLLTAQVLCRRGVTDKGVAERFLNPTLGDLHDPADLPGAERASTRLLQAVVNREPIVIYGDYDVDGVTATAILFHMLKTADEDADVRRYVPHRLEEGYGLNGEAIEKLAADGARVIVSVDCGITAVEPAEAAKRAGVDLIITDHHELPPDGVLPDAYAIVHPRIPRNLDEGANTSGGGVSGWGRSGYQSVEESGYESPEEAFAAGDGGSDDDEGSAGAPVEELEVGEVGGAEEGGYPFGELCGAGVAYKLAWQFARTWCGSDRVTKTYKKLLVDLLPYAALGTIADIVPLVDENRVITVFGLQHIKKTPFAGLNALIDTSRLRDEKIDSYHVGFVLGPRLNACGRMGHAKRAIRLLTDVPHREAVGIAQFLNQENADRRQTQLDIFEEAMEKVVELGYDDDDVRAIVLDDEEWHPGVVGIVCSRLVETFGRPAILINTGGEQAKGSARSIAGFNMHDALTACDTHLDSYGGHAMAAGLTVSPEKVGAFREEMLSYAKERLEPDDLVLVLEVDAEVRLGDLTLEKVQELFRLQPFGRSNPTPLVVVKGVRLDRGAESMGQNGKHMSMYVTQDGVTMRCLGWNMGEMVETLVGGKEIDLVGELSVNTFKGNTTVELVVKDVRFAPEVSSR